MLRVAERLLQALRILAGLDKDQSWSPMHVALYAFLGLIGFVLVAAWITGTPLECMAGGVCAR